jgi:hypothetical protein
MKLCFLKTMARRLSLVGSFPLQIRFAFPEPLSAGGASRTNKQKKTTKNSGANLKL